METKEKAKEIYFSMLNAGRGITSDYLAGECAMIMVNEIIDELQCIKEIYKIAPSYLTYWRSVKKELKKLTHKK